MVGRRVSLPRRKASGKENERCALFWFCREAQMQVPSEKGTPLCFYSCHCHVSQMIALLKVIAL